MEENSREKLELQQKINEALENASDITKAYGQVLIANLDKEEKISDNLKDRVKTLTDISAATSSDLSYKEKTSKLAEITKKAQEELVTIREKQLDIEKKYSQEGKKSTKNFRDLKSAFFDLEDRAGELETVIAIGNAEQDRVDKTKELTDVQKQQAKAVMAGFNKILGSVKKIPGGGMFLSAMGLGEENVKKIGENFNKYLSGEVKGFGKVFEVGGKNLGRMVKGGLALGAAIGITVGLFKVLFKIGKAFAAVTDTLGKEFGVLGTDLSSGVVENLRASRREAIALGNNIGDLTATTSTLSNEFGIGLEEASNLSLKVLDTSKALGLSAAEGAKLFGVLMTAGNLSDVMAERMAESTFQLAAQNNVNPSMVMKDIADSAELIAKFGADNLDSITNSAIQARKLGLSLKTVENISGNLLDFQSSLNAEIEASLITGQDINFQKARELALTGELDKMMAEVLKQVGGEAEFNKMNVFQRQSLAKSLGLSVTEMEKLVSAQDDSVVKSKSFVDLLGKDGMSVLTSLMNEIKSLGAVFVERIGPHVMDMVKNIKGFLEDDSGMNQLVGFAESIADVMVSIVRNIDVVMGALGAVMGASLGFMLGGPVGAAIGLFAGGALGFGAGAAMTPTGTGKGIVVAEGIVSAQSGMIATEQGAVNVHPGEAIVPIEQLGAFISDAMKPVVAEIRELQRENVAQTRAIKNQTGEFIGGMETLA